ncbi:MAG: hypothetical protein BGO98_04435 [Myxococcales bacterium 68-20]|nr:hypothetical protein [Myxococcales bacterium]OJY20544.1 MAG: hypothetical protein BGO98_04435 [Myxococcales bacterium 68-20]
MSATAANLVDSVMTKVTLRQWVLTVTFAWRKRFAPGTSDDGAGVSSSGRLTPAWSLRGASR